MSNEAFFQGIWPLDGRGSAMTSKSMDVFDLRDRVVDEYRQFATSFTTIHANDIRSQVDAIYGQGRFWPSIQRTCESS